MFRKRITSARAGEANNGGGGHGPRTLIVRRECVDRQQTNVTANRDASCGYISSPAHGLAPSLHSASLLCILALTRTLSHSHPPHSHTMSSSPSWMMRCALILLTLIVPVNSTVTLEPTALFFVLAFPVLGSLYLIVTAVLSALGLLLRTLLTVSRCLFRGLFLLLAAPRFILHVHRHAYTILCDRIRRTKRACKVFVITFVKTLARQVLLAFLRPIGLALQTMVVWAATFLIDTLTAVVLGAGYAVVCGVKLAWGHRWTPISVFWAGLAGFKTMVCDVYKVRCDFFSLASQC